MNELARMSEGSIEERICSGSIPNVSDWTNGATQPELAQVAQIYGFTQIYPVCQGPEGWDQWLNDNGPLLVQVPGNAYHSIVVAGINIGAEDSVEPAKVHVMDPWNGDMWLEFDKEVLGCNYNGHCRTMRW